MWVTMLALADKDGVVEGSVPGLADMARLTVNEARAAIEILSKPDPDSRSKVEDGRRIVPVDGGWVLVNHGHYRELMGLEERREYLRVKQAEFRAKRKQVSTNVNNRNGVSQNVNTTDGDGNGVASGSSGKGDGGKTALQLRVESWFHRRAKTPWGKAELKAWDANRLCVESATEEDLALLEKRFADPAQAQYRRHDLATLLNNWPAEIDRARNHATNGKPPSRFADAF